MNLVKSAKKWTRAEIDDFYKRANKRDAWIENQMVERRYFDAKRRLIRAFYNIGATPEWEKALVKEALKDFLKLEYEGDLAVRKGWTPENN